MAYSVASLAAPVSIQVDSEYQPAVAVRVDEASGQTELLVIIHNAEPRWVSIDRIHGATVKT